MTETKINYVCSLTKDDEDNYKLEVKFNLNSDMKKCFDEYSNSRNINFTTTIYKFIREVILKQIDEDF